ncbi:cysteine hydrolase family protein [Mycetocola sp. JXN-3]|uniref:cysteine hydrolase family protein n=1 Tax=Mycetocola sp. JXN-3 TaxID=2116510 RepID=UPI00165D2AD9|nr:cysteine hydrolase family protein [Mycetocola sp. JXN-3]
MTQHAPLAGPALIVIDVQRGFEDLAFWGPRNNPHCEKNIAALIARWREREWPVVFVQHDSDDPASPLHPHNPGHALAGLIEGEPDLLVRKRVNSSFHGTPDLHAWLTENSLSEVVICGITTNHCCETTARLAGNLGYETTFVLDATHTFDRAAPDGTVVTADELARITATNLHGEFATVLGTREVLERTAR